MALAVPMGKGWGVLIVGALLLFAVTLGSVYVAPSCAVAWEMNKSTNGVWIERSSDDTAAASATVQVYYDYKGGSYWSPTYTQTSGASYNANKTVGTLDASTGEAWEIALEPGYRCQLVRISYSGKTWNMAVLNEPLAVHDAAPAVTPVYASANADAFPVSVDQTLSISADGTMPVEVVGLGSGSGSETIDGILVVLMFMAGWLFAGALSRE